MRSGQHYTDRHTATTFNDSLMWSASHRILTAQLCRGIVKRCFKRTLSLFACFVTRPWPCFTRNLSLLSFFRSHLLLSLGFIACNVGKQLYNCRHIATTFNDSFKSFAFDPFLVSLGYIACYASKQPYGCHHIATTFNDSYKDFYVLILFSCHWDT